MSIEPRDDLESEERMEAEAFSGFGKILCPWCESNNDANVSFLGTMGDLEVHRCRYCGSCFHRRNAS